jgi:hypothetical protein
MITNWRDLYQAAMLELRPEQLSLRISEAEKAIHQRTTELRRDDANSVTELRELEDALRGLRVLASTECVLLPSAPRRFPQGETRS